MKNRLMLAGVTAGALMVSGLAFVQPSSAGWGPPFACGASDKASEITWNQGIPTPGAPIVAITGVLNIETADSTDGDADWTVEELEEAKPLMLYAFRDRLTDRTINEEEYDFSRRFEMGLQSKTIERINEKWNAKKLPIAVDDEIKELAKKTRLELWSSVDTNMKVITLKKQDQKLLNAGPLLRVLRKYEKVNKGLVAKEIKRIEKAEKLMKKNEESAAK